MVCEEVHLGADGQMELVGLIDGNNTEQVALSVPWQRQF